MHPLTPDDFNEQQILPPNHVTYSTQEVAFMLEQPRVMEIQYYVYTECFAKRRLQQQTTGSILDRERYLESEMISPGSRATCPNDLPDSFRDNGFLLGKRWLGQVPDSLKYDVDDIQGHEFWPAFLHVLYL